MPDNDRKNDTAPDAPGCECAIQIADILTRLEKLEREALTVEKLASLPPSSLVQAVQKVTL
jgi:hypothetical protein